MGLAGVGKAAKIVIIEQAVVEPDPRRRTVLVMLETLEILDGKVAVPASARTLLHELGGYVHEAKLNQ